MKTILRVLLGRKLFCRLFHRPQFSETIVWYGLWCHSCGVFHGRDRRERGTGRD